MKWFYRILIFLFFIPVQTLLLEQIKMGGVKPDLALLLVFAQGWFYGEVNGLLWGLALGGLLDLFSIGILGINLVLKGAVGLLAGVFGKSLLNLSFWGSSLIIFILSPLHDLIGTLLWQGIGEGGFTVKMMGQIFLRAVYNTLFAAALFYVFSNIINKKGTSKYAGVLFSTGRKSGFPD